MTTERRVYIAQCLCPQRHNIASLIASPEMRKERLAPPMTIRIARPRREEE